MLVYFSKDQGKMLRNWELYSPGSGMKLRWWLGFVRKTQFLVPLVLFPIFFVWALVEAFPVVVLTGWFSPRQGMLPAFMTSNWAGGVWSTMIMPW